MGQSSVHHRHGDVCVATALLAFWAAIGCSNTDLVRGSELRRTAIVKAVERVQPSIVSIHGHKTVAPSAEQLADGEGQRRVNGMGTGVVIDQRGYIITNHHVVEGVSRIQVTLSNGQTHSARLLDHDPKTDLAIIKIDVDKPLPVMSIGTSSDLMLGEPVVAIGNAYGYKNTVTRGIISALHRTVQVSEAQKYEDLIQADPSINPGNSGGPLLNVDGEMIGVTVAVRVGAQGIGFAIPVDQAMTVAATMLNIQQLDHHWHGVVGQTLNSAGRSQFVVKSVRPNSPATKSDLQAGDVIKSAIKLDINRALDLERALLGRSIGEEVELVIQRNGQPRTLSLVIDAAPRSVPTVPNRMWQVLGLKLAPISKKHFRQIDSRYRGGLRVVAVRPESPAATQGLRRGDVLVGMHIWETTTLENVSYILDRPDFTQFQPIKVHILRGSETYYGHLPVSLRSRR